MAGSAEEYEALRASYIAELDSEMTGLVSWWEEIGDEHGLRDDLPRAKKWPTGIAGHPRVIEIFRRYYLAIDELNDWNEIDWQSRQVEHAVEDLWSGTVEDPDRLFARPQDLLIHDLAGDRPDLHEIMQGIAMVPIGMNHNKDLV
jgi:hypothetical protein